MYRNPWSLDTTAIGWVERNGIAQRPILVVGFDGNSRDCREYLNDTALTDLWPVSVNVTFRLHTNIDEIDANGVLGIADSAGNYLLEFETDARQVFEFVDAVHQYADVTGGVVQYELWLETDDGVVMEWVESVFLVATSENEILRHRSCIPPGLDI